MPSMAQTNRTRPTPPPYNQWAIREDWVLNWLSATGGTAFRNRWKNHSPTATPAARLSRNRTTITTNPGDMEEPPVILRRTSFTSNTSQGTGPDASIAAHHPG